MSMALQTEDVLYRLRCIQLAAMSGVSSGAAGVELKSEIPSELWRSDRIYRYPAKMTPKIAVTFISEVLRESESDPGNLTFHDPMCGSGTTALVARWRGFKVTSSDIMPTSVQIARAKTTRLSDEGVDALREYGKSRLLSGGRKPKDTEEWPTWNVWYKPRVLRALEDIRDTISIERRRAHYPHLLVALFKTAWDVSAADRGVIVPTQGRYGSGPPEMKPSEVRGAFREHLSRSVKVQEALSVLEYPRGRPTVRQGNALDESSWPETKLDVALTSPPYGCGLDYARALSLQEHVWGSCSSDRNWNECMVGRRNYLQPNADELPSAITREPWFQTVLEKDPGRSKMLVQYLNDMDSFFNIAKRRLKSGGKLGIVIGNPEVARTRVPLNEAVKHLASDAGFSSDGEDREDRIKSRVQNLKLRSASAPIQTEWLLSFSRD